jgi:tight adherence protein B
MNPLVILLCAIAGICGLVYAWVSRADRRRQLVQQRLLSLVPVETEPTLRLTLPGRIRRAAHKSTAFQFYQKIRGLLDSAFEASGNRIGLTHLIIAGAVAAFIAIGFTSRILMLNPTLVTLLGGAAALGAPFVLLRLVQSRYQSRFLDAFPDALDLIARGVRAGLPVNEAVVVAGREIVDPVGSELRRTLAQVQIGVPMVDALTQTADRIRVADFRFLVVALALQSRTGGSLAETLANLSGVIRARKALRLKARALSAEAKASAAVLAALPFVVGGLMFLMNRELVGPLFTDPRGRFMVGIAFLSLVTGLTVMAVMVKRAVR